MRFCSVKTEEHQDVQSVHRIRNLLIGNRTAVANQARGILAEYGIAIPVGISYVRSCLAAIYGDNPYNMSVTMLEVLCVLYRSLQHFDQEIEVCDKRIEALFKNDERCKLLETIPGIGKIGATILVSVLGNGAMFKNGRHFAAFLGLVPKQHSSGEKDRLRENLITSVVL